MLGTEKVTTTRDWKDANVTALHKKGSKTDVGNYRPVSLTSVPCKILEGLIKSRILEHMNINNLNSTYQHGFCCVWTIILLYTCITTINHSLCIDESLLLFPLLHAKIVECSTCL